MTPSLNKPDMEGLKRDIPTKYPKNMPLKASEEWESWLANTEFNLLSVPDNYIWPVDKLKNTSRTVLASNGELPHELFELREKEIQPIIIIKMQQWALKSQAFKWSYRYKREIIRGVHYSNPFCIQL